MILHAGLVALHAGGAWRGALLLGPSGAGKSDLALRCLEAGFALVADDRVSLWTSGEGVYGAPPASLAGLIEARGLGVLAVRHRPWTQIVLAAHCVTSGEAERLPDPRAYEVLDRALPALSLAPLEASAPAKLRQALIGLGVRAETA